MKNRAEFKFKGNLALLVTGFIFCTAGITPANALNLAPAPLNLFASQPPLIMMTMARDHKLFYEAYNDYSDLDSDGTLDMYYKPSIEYYGYFDSNKCYNYVSGIFTPVAVTADKKCTGTANDTYWSGDFLNYLTTSRIDALRKVFYGGKRSTDTATQTILERSFIPQDAHSWGKEYESAARDGYDIRDYTPLALPKSGSRHLFANTTLTSDTSPPLLRVLNDSSYRIWEWVSIERPVAGTQCATGNNDRHDCATATGGWSIIPASSTAGLSDLTQTTYRTSGANPASQAAFDTFESTNGTATNKCGSGAAATINGTGNPFKPGSATSGTCTDNNYLTVFEGKLNLAAADTYTFGIDGDDAVDLFIDGTQRVGWYGGHGKTGSPPSADHTVAVTLSAGTHTIKFRHQEGNGDDSYYLYWQSASSAIIDYNVRVEVCKTITGVSAADLEGREQNCQGYGSAPVIYKPTGLLHKYGQNNGMYFGLLTGSYDQNTNGGILRKEVSSITNEVETNTGIYKESGSTCGLSGATTCVKGIVGTVDRLKITAFNYGNQSYSCGWITTRPMNSGECEMWGNPLGEMVYEGLRYFSGKSAATSSFTSSSTRDDSLGLPRVTSWENPYGTGKFPTCSKPFFMLVSDVYPSFDSDSTPGSDSNFGTFSGDISDLNASTLGQSMWNVEFGASSSKNIFIGQSGSTYDNAPTVKSASSFGDIRGLSPSEPTRQGSYSAATMAFYGRTHDLNSADGAQETSTYSIALAPPLPTIEIPVGDNKIALVPFAKSVAGSSIDADKTKFQPTNQIVDFYVDTINNTTSNNSNSSINGGRAYYKFRINYEDVEQGADHDMDAIATYEVKLNADKTVTVNISSDYAAGGIVQHMGYVISGTTKDGVYLEVRDMGTTDAEDPNYFLDTPQTTGAKLSLASTRTFTASSSAAAGTILKDPLWYAAKFGGFSEAAPMTITNKPDETAKWDADGDGAPDNYFLVVNPLKMLSQMDKALAKISNELGAMSMQTASTRAFSSDTLLFQPRYNSNGWSGELNAYKVTKNSVSAASWQAQNKLLSKTSSTRVILTYPGIPFTWTAINSSGAPADLKASLNKAANGTVDSLGSNRVTYLRGDEVSGMRSRPTIAASTDPNKLGDIVNSQPQYVPGPNLGYADAGYSGFAADKSSRTAMVYIGVNDGMLHGFNAVTGEELLGYVPSEMYRTRGAQQPLSKLTQTDYGKTSNQHRFYVDGTPTPGDICTGSCAAKTDWKSILVGGLNSGGQGIYALDITNPALFSETNASDIYKWEFLDHDHDADTSSTTITGDADLGYTYSRPFIVKLCTARDSSSTSSPKICTASHWYVIFGNGYNNTEADGFAGSGDAVLYVLDADTGFLVKKINAYEADGVNSNGLSELAPIDSDGDGTVDYVYAGDLKGNLWRVDFASSSISDWAAASLGSGTSTDPLPLYVATDQQATPKRQPITTAPDVISHPQGGTLVVFGTGSYIDVNDNTDKQAQTLYGIWDKFDGQAVASSATRSNLQAQTIATTTVTASATSYTSTGPVTSTNEYRAISDSTPSWNAVSGWYVNLPDLGERIVYNPVIQGGTVLKFSTAVPSTDICKEGGDRWDYFLNVLTGGRLSWSVFSDVPALNFGLSDDVFASGRKSSGISAPPTEICAGKGQCVAFDNNGTFNTNKGAAGAGRISWREILGD